MPEQFDPHQLHTDSFLLGHLTDMDEHEVRSKATEYVRAEKYGHLNGRQEVERERLFSHFIFELVMKARERDNLETSWAW